MKLSFLLALLPFVHCLEVQIIGGNISSSTLCVSLQSKTRSGFSHFCGGSLIDIGNESAVLTAAHCVIYGPPARVVLNSTDLRKPRYVAKEFTLKIHPAYQRSSNLNDVALLFLKERPPQSVRRVRLPRLTKLPRLSTVLGWGRTSVDVFDSPQLLREVQVPVVPRSKCVRAYGKIPTSQFCAGYDEGLKDSCQGDSGGPLLVDDVVYGIVSWGKSCALPGYYGVYQKTAAFRDFLEYFA